MGALSVDATLGFDHGKTKIRLFNWLITKGDVEPDVSEYVDHWRTFRAVRPAIRECVALALAKAHDKRHVDQSNHVGANAVPKCEIRPCRTRAVSSALDALNRYSLERDSPRGRVIDAAAAVHAGLRNVSSKALLDAIAGVHRHLEQAYETANANPDVLPVMVSQSHTDRLLPALEQVLWRAGHLESEPPTRIMLTPDDLRFPLVTYQKSLALLETLESAKVLAAELNSDLRNSMVSSSAPGKRRGRPTFALLNQIRFCLHEGGFSASHIARLVPDGPHETEEQRDAAMQRVKHGLRAHRIERAAREAS